MSQLDKILGSRQFASAESLRRMLSFVVRKIVQHQRDKFKEYVIGVEVFGRNDTFDPRTDPIVRVQASRLRSKLRSYYRLDGRGDSILIEIPKGHYVPVVKLKNTFAENGKNGRPKLQMSARKTSIAVMPFLNLSDDDFFSEGLTEEIIDTLTQSAALHIIPVSSLSSFGEKPEELSRRRNVAIMLHGSVQKVGRRARTKVRLIDFGSGHTLWSGSYETSVSKIFDAQQRIARQIASGLGLIFGVDLLVRNTVPKTSRQN